MKNLKGLFEKTWLSAIPTRAIVGFVLFAIFFVVGFQNCGKGFRSASSRNSSYTSKNFVFDASEPLTDVSNDGSRVTVTAVGAMYAIAQRDAKVQVKVEVRWGDGEVACFNEALADRATSYSRQNSFIINCPFEYTAESPFFIYYYARVGSSASWELVSGGPFGVWDAGPEPLTGDSNRNGKIDGTEKGLVSEATDRGYRCDYQAQMESWVYDPQRPTTRDGYRYTDSTGRRNYACVRESCVKAGDYFFGHYACCGSSSLSTDSLKCETGGGGIERIGDTNRNGHIDKYDPATRQEVGSLIQAYGALRAQPKCNPGSTLKDWGYDFNTGDRYRASNGEPGYVCLEALCVPQGKIRSTVTVASASGTETLTYSCCERLAPDSSNVCRPIPSPTPPTLPSIPQYSPPPPQPSPVTSPRVSTGPSPVPSPRLSPCALSATPASPATEGAPITWNITGPGAAGAVAYLKQWTPQVSGGPAPTPISDLRLGLKPSGGATAYPQPSSQPLPVGTHLRQAVIKDAAGNPLCIPNPSPALAYVIQARPDPRIDTVDVVHQDVFDADFTYLNIAGSFRGLPEKQGADLDFRVSTSGSGCPATVTSVSQSATLVSAKFANLNNDATCRVTVTYRVPGETQDKTTFKDGVLIRKYAAPTVASIAGINQEYNDQDAPGYTYMTVYGTFPELPQKNFEECVGGDYQAELIGTGCPAKADICGFFQNSGQVNFRFPNLAVDTTCNVKITYTKSKAYSAEKSELVKAHSAGGPATVSWTRTAHFPDDPLSNLTYVEIGGTFPGIPSYENPTGSENPPAATVRLEGPGCPGDTRTSYQSPGQINASFSNIGATATCKVTVTYTGSLGSKTAELANQTIRTYPHISDFNFRAPTTGEPNYTYVEVIGYFPQLRTINSPPFNDATVTSPNCGDIGFTVTYQGTRGSQPAGAAGEQINARYLNLPANRDCRLQIQYTSGGLTYMDRSDVQLRHYDTPGGGGPSPDPSPISQPSPSPSPISQPSPSPSPGGGAEAQIDSANPSHRYDNPDIAQYTYVTLYGTFPNLATATPGSSLSITVANCGANGIQQQHQSPGQINLRFLNLASAGTCNITISYTANGNYSASTSLAVPKYTLSPTVKPTISGMGGSGCGAAWVTGSDFPQISDLEVVIRNKDGSKSAPIPDSSVIREYAALTIMVPDTPSGEMDPDDGHEWSWQEVFDKSEIWFTINNTSISNGWENTTAETCTP